MRSIRSSSAAASVFATSPVLADEKRIRGLLQADERPEGERS
jgi:hypothetical protein